MNWIFKNATPESCGINSKDILNFIKDICKGENNQETHSFLMIRHGKLVFEGYLRALQTWIIAISDRTPFAIGA